MYETPRLICVGPASEVVLGNLGTGFDFDGTSLTGEMEFFEDPFAPSTGE